MTTLTTSAFVSTKVIPLGSCAFRQPYATSHCRYIHGYRLQAKFWFACNTLDKNNWAVDFGALKPLKQILEQQFDHTTVVWAEDPDLQTFIDLNKKGIIDLRVMKDGVGIEMFAKYCHQQADQFVRNFTNNRCWCQKVEVWEHDQNSATYESHNALTLKSEIPSEIAIVNQLLNEDKPVEQTPSQVESVKTTAPEKTIVVDNKPVEESGARLYGVKTQGYKDMFAGTSWGKGSDQNR